MITKIKLTITLVSALYFFTACNDTSTTTEKEKTDSTKMNNMKNDNMNNMSSNDMSNMDNGLMNASNMMMGNMGKMKMTGDFDLDFANMMIEHHQGAIDLSKIEILKGTDEKIKGMAQNILTAQTAEIGMMREIIKNYKPSGMDMGKHNELSEETETMGNRMRNMQMSGQTDKDFAKMMISHHESAVKMFKYELIHGMNKELKKMAEDGIKAQGKEIDEFKSLMSK